MVHRKVIETKIGNALRSLSFYHLLRLFFESIPLEKARSCCLQATIWVKSIVLWIRERYNLTTLLSLQPKINIKESITNVLSIILFIVFKYFDHFIALFFLYKIRRYYYDIIQAPYSTPILLDQCQMEAMEYHHHCHY